MSVDVENGGLVVAFEGEVHLLALGHAIVELVEIAFALESQTSRLGVGQIHLSMVGFKEHIALLQIAHTATAISQVVDSDECVILVGIHLLAINLGRNDFAITVECHVYSATYSAS